MSERKKIAMMAFLKSDLFLRFFGGFVVGTLGVLTLVPEEQTLTTAAHAKPAPVEMIDRAAG